MTLRQALRLARTLRDPTHPAEAGVQAGASRRQISPAGAHRPAVSAETGGKPGLTIVRPGERSAPASRKPFEKGQLARRFL